MSLLFNMGLLGIDRAIRNLKPANRATYRQYVLLLQADNQTDEAANIVLTNIIRALNEGTILSTTCRRIGYALLSLLDIEDEVDNTVIIRLGGAMLSEAVSLDLITVEKRVAISKAGKVKEMWMISCADEDLRMMALDNEHVKLVANAGFVEWQRPTMHINDSKIDIVMKARNYNLLHNYRRDQMPLVYDALNKLGRTEWVINTDLLSVLSANSDLVVVPEIVPEDEIQAASKHINSTTRTALHIHELVFNELIGKGYTEGEAKSGAERKAAKYNIKNAKDAKKVIRRWAQRRDYDTVLKNATAYGNDVLNFLYRCDSRGRIYAFNSHYLNPQGSDVAKSLLSYANPKPVSVSDLAITIANHAGEDKIPYNDRLAWVRDNEDYILEFGTNPSSPVVREWLIENEISTEEKSRIQFLAACIEWVKLTDWIAAGHSQDDFLCSIPVAYDATNSGLQVLSIIGRDSYIAPYVNICKTDTVGDVYRLIGKAVAEKKPIDTLAATIPADDKMWRKIVKRNVMTKSYAAKRFGMGTQQWEDKPDSDSEKNSIAKEVWANLEFNECIQLGAVTYDTCSEYLKQAHELMEACQTAASLNDNPTITWRLPNGFTAFQHKEIFEEDHTIDLRLGDQKVSVKLYKATGRGDKRAHESAIAPDVVHSIDAWLLTIIANNLPADANLAFVHDAFGSDSIYGPDIQDVARNAYYEISCRDNFALILKQIADGQDVELPSPGDYDPASIFEADYIVC